MGSGKTDKVRAVPLNDSAIDVLNKQDTKDEFEHVFINRQTGKPYSTIQKVWNRLRNVADLGHVRIHDLKHQYASFLVNSGVSLYYGRDFGAFNAQSDQEICPFINGHSSICSGNCSFPDKQFDEKDGLMDGPGDAARTPSPGAPDGGENLES